MTECHECLGSLRAETRGVDHGGNVAAAVGLASLLVIAVVVVLVSRASVAGSWWRS